MTKKLIQYRHRAEAARERGMSVISMNINGLPVLIISWEGEFKDEHEDNWPKRETDIAGGQGKGHLERNRNPSIFSNRMLPLDQS